MTALGVVLTVARVAWSGLDIDAVDRAFETSDLALHEIGCVNWPAQYPAKPQVRFRIAHSGDEIFIKYYVREPELRASFAEDGGRPWTDSCVEFFFSPTRDDTYYNLEMACNGRGILHGKTPEGETLDPALVSKVRRLSSLGGEAFGTRAAAPGENGEGEGEEWTLTVAVPADVFALDGGVPRIDGTARLDGLVASGNFYKCGDGLAEPHFVSWTPIDTPRPYFHQPRFFGTIRFE